MSLALLKKLISHSIQEILIDRFTAIVTFILGILFFSIEMIAGFVFFEHIDNLMGWSLTDYLLLVSTASTISFLYQTLFVVSHEQLPEAIIEGELDYVLVRPVSSLLYFSLYRVDIPSFINLLVCGSVQIYFLQSYSLSIIQMLLFVISILLASYLVFLLNHFAVCVSFWFENASSVQGVPEYLTDFSARPLSIYPNVIRFVFTWIVPILIGMNLPVLIVKSLDYGIYVVYLGIVALVGTIFAKIIWNKGLKKYVSAH